MSSPHRLATAGLLALGIVGVVAAVPGVAAAAPAGSYAGPVALGSDGRFVLDGIDVDAQKVTLRLHIHNPRNVIVQYVCPDKAQAAAAEIVTGTDKPRQAIDSYCQAHPSATVNVKPRTDFPITGVFPPGSWTDGKFAVSWHGASSPKLTLSEGRIVGGTAQDGTPWYGDNLWAALVLIVGTLVVGGLWLRLLLRRGRFLIAVGAAGVAWFTGMHDWRMLLLVGTLAALAVVVVTKGFGLLNAAAGGGYQGGYQGGYAGGYQGGQSGLSGESGGWDSRPEPQADSGWGGGGPVDRGFYGDGPQQGTARPADEPGSIWGDGPGQGTRTPFSEPGGLYSDRPFGGS